MQSVGIYRMSLKFTPIIVDAPQRSPEWFAKRLGNLTASRLNDALDYYAVKKSDIAKAIVAYQNKGINYEQDDVLAKLHDQYPLEFCLRAGIEIAEKSTRFTYRKDIVAERITGLPGELDPYITKDMMWGQAQEPHARALYQLLHKHIVEEAPLMLHPKLLCGATPDGFVIDRETGELGTLEIKCLKSKNHLYEVIMYDEIPKTYHNQIYMQMWISGRDWCDFVAYDSRVKDGLHIFVKRMLADEFYITEVMYPGIVRFLEECDADERKFYAIRNAKLGKKAKSEVILN